MMMTRSSTTWVAANDRFKTRSENWMSMGIVAAVVAHFGAFTLFPTFSAEDFVFEGEEITVVELPPEIEIPRPPDEIARPATPRIANTPIDDTTIPLTDFERNPVKDLAPPPARARVTDEPIWVDRDQEPRLTNEAELIKIAEQRYPSMLKEAGISGRVGVFFFVSETGEVTNAVVQSSSGYAQFDAVALEVAKAGKFVPAMNMDRPVGVWIALPIQFKTH